MTETYKLIPGKYDVEVSNVMPKANEISSLATRGSSEKPFPQRAEI